MSRVCSTCGEALVLTGRQVPLNRVSSCPNFNVQLLASLKVSFSEKPPTFILVDVSEQLHRALVS